MNIIFNEHRDANRHHASLQEDSSIGAHESFENQLRGVVRHDGSILREKEPESSQSQTCKCRPIRKENRLLALFDMIMLLLIVVQSAIYMDLLIVYLKDLGKPEGSPRVNKGPF